MKQTLRHASHAVAPRHPCALQLKSGTSQPKQQSRLCSPAGSGKLRTQAEGVADGVHLLPHQQIC